MSIIIAYNRFGNKEFFKDEPIKLTKNCDINESIYKNKKLIKIWNFHRNNISPKSIGVKSKTKVWWKCDKGHEWKFSPYRQNNDKCPVCNNVIIIPNINSFGIINNHLLKEWNYSKNIIDPYTVFPFARTKVWWICKNKHTWKAAIYDRAKKKRGCPYCSNRYVLEGYNDLLTKYPELSKQWDYKKNDILPQEVFYSSQNKYWWICDLDHSYCASPKNRTKRKSGCPHCSRKISLQEKELYNYILEIYKGKILLNNRKIIKPKELDIYLPDIGIGFEYNGMFWHSEDNVREDEIHYKKWKMCHELNIELMTIWSHDWLNYKEETKQKIKYLIDYHNNDSNITLKDIEKYVKYDNDHIISNNDNSFNKILTDNGYKLTKVLEPQVFYYCNNKIFYDNKIERKNSYKIKNSGFSVFIKK